MSRVTQSLSQLLTSFGPGAMMDLPTRSVVVSGLDHWDNAKAAFKRIEEPRLAALLHSVLTQNNRWDATKPVQFRTPPIARDNRNDSDPAGVAVRVFPTWFTCEGVTDDGSTNQSVSDRSTADRGKDPRDRGGAVNASSFEGLSLDCRGMKCPRPIIEVARRISEVNVGSVLQLLADDPAAGPDLAAWCRMRGQTLVASDPPRFIVRREA